MTRQKKTMTTNCSVIGWVLDADFAKVLVLEENGKVVAQATSPEGDPNRYAIQTGAFRRGKQIIDPVTNELLGYEMENVSSAMAALA
jgi:hypothetical protein